MFTSESSTRCGPSERGRENLTGICGVVPLTGKVNLTSNLLRKKERKGESMQQ